MRAIPLIVLACSAPVALCAPTVFAQQAQFQGNPTFFSGDPPAFVTAGTPTSDIYYPNATYYFTMNLPPKAIQSLGQVTIQQQQSPETIQFNLKNTQAFQGTQGRKEKTLNIKTVTLDPRTQTIAITFDPPVPPGTTFTVSLEAKQNPSTSGVYFFDITALPAGTNPSPFELGMARFQFYAPFR